MASNLSHVSNPTSVTVSAPGKIHVSGEHAVVYGKPALLTTISPRVFVTISSSPQTQIDSEGQDGDFEPIKTYISHIVSLVEKHFQKKMPNFHLKITSQIPFGSGLGSSAALATASIGALILFCGEKWNATTINELAHEAEKFQHGNPSGGDTSIVTHGGLLWYRKEFDFLKTFWLLPFKIPQNFPKVTLVLTHREESTKELVAFVSKRTNTEEIFNNIEKETKKIVQAIHDENVDQFTDALKQNERCLEQLGVVSESVLPFISEIENTGAIAKISGAGGIASGSGTVVVFHSKNQEIDAIISKYNYQKLEVTLSGEGVRQERIIV